LDRELELFLAVLDDGAAFADRIDPGVRQQLAAASGAGFWSRYSFRPIALSAQPLFAILLGLAACSDQVRLTVIDGEMFPDAAQKDRVNSAPTVILDDRFRWTGSVDAVELVTLMLDRDPASLGADALRGMIEEGNAEGVARMMAESEKYF
jgi:alkyl hydroperoxide reductase subunit AhpF